MTHFQLRIRDDAPKNIELWLLVVPAGKRAAQWQLSHVYTPEEQYPLGTDRYALNRANLFVDILALADANAHAATADKAWEVLGLDATGASTVSAAPSTDTQRTSESASANAHDYSLVSVKNLAQRAARVAADGSGNARRFKDARSLWMKLEKHVATALAQSVTEPIVEVRKTHNWKKNQAFKNVSANPEAWFVLNVFSRSNPRKDPFVAIRSISALWEYMSERSAGDDKALATIEKQQNSVSLNLDYPAYGEIAALAADSNMLVFPDDASFISWIRDNAGKIDEIERDTLVEAHIVPNLALETDDPAYIPAASTGTVLHLANMLEKQAML